MNHQKSFFLYINIQNIFAKIRSSFKIKRTLTLFFENMTKSEIKFDYINTIKNKLKKIKVKAIKGISNNVEPSLKILTIQEGIIFFCKNIQCSHIGAPTFVGLE